jgi:hypothetical protein
MNKVLTVDFDETLAVTQNGAWGGENLVPIPRIVDFVKQKHKEGYEIHIVTFRNWSNKEQVNDFCKGYKIPIKSIVCTEGTNKIPFFFRISLRRAASSPPIYVKCRAAVANFSTKLSNRGGVSSFGQPPL